MPLLVASMLHLREQAEELNKYPFGRSPDSSRTAKSDNKVSLFKRISSAKPSNSASGTVSILSQPENPVRPPVHHVTVVHEVEQMSYSMTEREKEYSRDGRERHQSPDSDSFDDLEKRP